MENHKINNGEQGEEFHFEPQGEGGLLAQCLQLICVFVEWTAFLNIIIIFCNYYCASLPIWYYQSPELVFC